MGFSVFPYYTHNEKGGIIVKSLRVDMFESNRNIKVEDIPEPFVYCEKQMIIVREGIKGYLHFPIYKGKSRLAVLTPDEMLKLTTELWGNHFTAFLRWTDLDCSNIYVVSLTPNSEGINDLTLHVTVSSMGSYTVKVPICQLEPYFIEAVRGFTLQPFNENEVLGYLIDNNLLNPVDIFSISDYAMERYRNMVDCSTSKYPDRYKAQHPLTAKMRVRDIFDLYDSRKD